MAAIEFQNISKRYPDGYVAIHGLDLEIRDGEFLVLVGPSGCGKSTALRMIAGLEDVSGGELVIGGIVANDLAPRERDIAMVFQSYALYPHLTVAENIGFGLKVRGLEPAEIATRVTETAKLLELEEHLKRKPAQLSGGQRQRVAMGRALVRSPKAFLMDEPLSNLDARLRGQMRAEIARLQKLSGITTVYVTHDQVEAMTMGDRVAVMRAGHLHQLDTPRALYDAPADLFVAGFIGAPPMNLIAARLVREGDGPALCFGDNRIGLTPAALAARPGLATHPAGKVVIGIRPEALAPVAPGTAGAISGTAAIVEDLGATLLIHVDLGVEGLIKADLLVEPDELPSAATRLRAMIDPAHGVKVGERVSLGVDPVRVHVFDAVSEKAVR